MLVAGLYLRVLRSHWRRLVPCSSQWTLGTLAAQNSLITWRHCSGLSPWWCPTMPWSQRYHFSPSASLTQRSLPARSQQHSNSAQSNWVARSTLIIIFSLLYILWCYYYNTYYHNSNWERLQLVSWWVGGGDSHNFHRASGGRSNNTYLGLSQSLTWRGVFTFPLSQTLKKFWNGQNIGRYYLLCDFNDPPQEAREEMFSIK